MSIYQGRVATHQSFQLVLQPALQNEGLPFAAVLGEEDVEQAFSDADAQFAQDEENTFTPAVTLWAFLSQVLHQGAQRSCRAAVARVIVLLTMLGRKPCSEDTGAYCRARAKLPEPVLERLTLQVGQRLERFAPADWRWKTRRVALVDGTTITAPDTKRNQAIYPQSSSQQAGLGFPLIRMVLLLSLATACVSGMALGPCAGKETGETALFRQLLPFLKRGDIVLADRYFCSYFMIALLLAYGVDCVFRQHQLRHMDFRRGQRLAKGDHIVSWERPRRPTWMDKDIYAQMPRVLNLREIGVHISQQGSRVKKMVVVTSLLDNRAYPAADVADLYHARWHAELDIRSIKETLAMGELRCKTPEMLRREVWVHLLVYNLLRKMNAQAALLDEEQERMPREISLSAALQKAAASWMVLSVGNQEFNESIASHHLSGLTTQRVGDRPNRVEPRAVKRRAHVIAVLTEPRDAARARRLEKSSG